MKRNILTSIVIFSIVLIGFSSCELVELEEMQQQVGMQDPMDPEDPVESLVPTSIPNNTDTVMQYLTNGTIKTWNALAFTIEDISGLQQCRLDDVIELNIDGTYTYDGGNVLCGAEDNTQTRQGTWMFSMEDLELVFDEGTPNETVTELTGLDKNSVAISGSYFGLDVLGVYNNVE